MLRNVRILFADPGARLAILLEAERRLHQWPWISVEHIDFDPLPIAFRELGFWVEKIHRTWRALHKEPNDGFCFGWIVWGSRCYRIERPRLFHLWRQQPIRLQEIGQCQHSEPCAGFL